MLLKLRQLNVPARLIRNVLDLPPNLAQQTSANAVLEGILSRPVYLAYVGRHESAGVEDLVPQDVDHSVNHLLGDSWTARTQTVLGSKVTYLPAKYKGRRHCKE